ncbi:MAG: AtpZ/AtpI family protein [Clostridiales bacterium]|nr:AtpZ/AtpI family protein [Clostridiales bacterium]
MEFIMAASVLLGMLLGKHPDDLTGASPWLLLFSILGVGAAIRSLLKMPGRKEEQLENG